MIHVQHLPDMPRNGQLLPHRGRRDHRTQLLGLAADGVFLAFLEHAVELEGVDDPFPCQPYDQAALLRLLNVVCGDEMPEQHPVVLLRDPVEVMQPQHPVGQRPGGQLAAGGQGGHGLMIQEAKGKPVQPGRLHPPLLQIQLHQGNALQKLPGNGGGQHGPHLRLVLPDDKPHFRRKLPPAGAPHTLQERRYRPWRVNLKRPLQPADVNAQLQRRGGHRGHVLGIVLHDALRRLPIGGGKVAVMDEETVGFVVQLAVMAQRGGHHLAFFPGIDENQTLFPPGMLENIPDAGVGVGGGVVGFFFQHGQGVGNLLVLCGLGVLDVEMLHAQPPLAALGVDFGNDGFPPRAQGQKFAGSLRVADGCGQSDAPGIDPRNPGQPLN